MSRRTEPRPNLMVAALACAALLACSSAPDDGAERAHPEPAPAVASSEAAPAPDAREAVPEVPGTGVKAYLDPETGRLVPPPADGIDSGDVAPDHPEIYRRDDEGLVQEALPGGGHKVHLAGRFAVATVATVAGDGTVETHCRQVGSPVESPEVSPVESPAEVGEEDGDE